MIELTNYKKKFKLDFNQGRFRIKTLETAEELKAAFRLRYKVFQVELIGLEESDLEDIDSFDFNADHLGIIDTQTDLLVATCRLNHSDFCHHFYSEQEFTLQPLLENDLKKLELGRVCVHENYRKGIMVILLWRAIAKYISLSKVDLMFGCGSVSTLDTDDAVLIYKYLNEKNKIKLIKNIKPTLNYHSDIFASKLDQFNNLLTNEQSKKAESILPSLCKSYFDIGCFVPCLPAFDYEFKCIDFLTVLNLKELNPFLKNKLFGGTVEI